jgi:peptide/nickel transport system ATP-binding protein
LASVLTPDPALGIPDMGLGDTYPDPTNIPSGCRFHPRCPRAFTKCTDTMPDHIRSQDGRLVECLLAIA